MLSTRLARSLALLLTTTLLMACASEPMTARTAISTRQIRSGLPVPNDATVLDLPDVGGATKVVPIDGPLIEKTGVPA